MARRLLFYDFEVFKHWWCVTFIDYATNKVKTICDDRQELLKFYMATRDKAIYVGFNNRHYDSVILKSIIIGEEELGWSPYEVSNALVRDRLSAFQISQKFYRVKTIEYDCMIDRASSLKLLEGMMGSSIKETDVPFDLDRPLTEEEKKLVIEYNVHDVEETIKVFNNTKSDFEAHLGLIQQFDLPSEDLVKTKARLSATVLGAKKMSEPSSPRDYEFVDCIRLSKYKWIQDWYDKNRGDMIWDETKGKEVKKTLKAEVFGLEHTFGIGGVHSALLKYHDDNSDGSLIVHSDVASFYPNMMIQHGKLSRAVEEPSKYSEILEKRLKLKREGNKKAQAPLKIVLNSTYGILNDKYNPMYDPQRSREVTINCQMLLLDLVEKIEEQMGDKCLYIQGNTDGVMFKIYDKKDYPQYEAICQEWQDRTKFALEHDFIKQIHQANVNNYVFEFENGKLECKGSMVQYNNPLKNDMSIINDAIRDYLIKKTPIEETIGNCNELIKFQHISKIGGTYKEVRHNGKVMNEKVVRTFASLRETDEGIFKVKDVEKNGVIEESVQKISDTSDRVFVENGEIIGVECPDYLDKQFYIDLAYKRLKSFI